MSSSLFRPEVLQAKQASWLGGIHMAHNPRLTAVACVALALAGGMMALGAFGKVARKVRISGVLMPQQGTVELSASAAGVLTHVHVVQGQWVQAGQTLFELNTDKISTLGSTAVLLASHIAQRKSTLALERHGRESQYVERKNNLDERIRALALEIGHSAQEHSLTLQRATLAQKTLMRYQQMATEGFVSDVQAQNKQEELIDLQARLENLSRNTSALQRELKSMQAERLNLEPQLRIDLGQIDRATASLHQESVENESRKSSRILAPHAGVLSTLHVLQGASLQPGQTIASLLPQSHHLLAHLYAPTRTAGFVIPGQEVWMRLAAYPYQKFGLARGTVMAVSGTPITPQDLPHGQGTALMANAQSNEPLYLIQVQLASQQVFAYGQPHSLRPGMSLEADVVQDMRGIWEWVLEPLLAIQVKSKVGV